MAFIGGDFGMVGDSSQMTMTLQDAQDAINYYCEISSEQGAKEPIALLGCPGKTPLITTDDPTGQVRGCWVLPGGQQALGIVGNEVYLLTITVQATQTSIPRFSIASVGHLLTNNGPVSIRDNGVRDPITGLGGYAVIVDGQYAFYYLLSGAPYSFSFTAGVSNGSPTITMPALTLLPNGLIITSGGIVSDSSSFIPANTLIIAADTNAQTITMNQNATNTNATDTITLTIPVFGQITDAGFLGADRVAFIEGWLIFNQPRTRTFYTTGPTPYQMLFPGAFYALKDSSTDNIVTLQENERELYLIGERTAEVWYDAGLTNFAFSRIPGVGPQMGCSAVHSLARVGERLIWLGRNEQGEDMVVMNNQYSWERVSTHAIEHAISSYPQVSDAIGWGYEEEGHMFYVLTFPTADITWCLDLTTWIKTQGALGWHKRLSYDPNGGVFHRDRANCFMNFGDVRIVGDYKSGQFHQLSRSIYTDAGNPLKAVRRSPHLWQKQNRGRLSFSQLQIEFTPGVGLQAGQGSNPQAMLRWSDDGGFTWSREVWAPIGKVGHTKNRAIWYLLGAANVRDRVWEVSFTDPVPRDIIGATCFAEAHAA
jgi:hypothetical protein